MWYPNNSQQEDEIGIPLRPELSCCVLKETMDRNKSIYAIDHCTRSAFFWQRKLISIYIHLLIKASTKQARLLFFTLVLCSSLPSIPLLTITFCRTIFNRQMVDGVLWVTQNHWQEPRSGVVYLAFSWMGTHFLRRACWLAYRSHLNMCHFSSVCGT